MPSVAAPPPPRRVDLDHGDGERPAAAMADDVPTGAIPVLANASALTMEMQNFERHPSPSDSKILKDFLGDKRRGKSNSVYASGEDGKFIQEALRAARPERCEAG